VYIPLYALARLLGICFLIAVGGFRIFASQSNLRRNLARGNRTQVATDSYFPRTCRIAGVASVAKSFGFDLTNSLENFNAFLFSAAMA